MKFLGGLITGIAVTLLVLFLMYKVEKSSSENLKSNENLPGLLIFPKKGDCITKNNLEIFQTIKPNMALAQFGKFPNETLVLLVNHEGISYYDEEKIKIPAKKCAKQIGTYQYQTKMEHLKTVPVVVIE